VPAMTCIMLLLPLVPLPAGARRAQPRQAAARPPRCAVHVTLSSTMRSMSSPASGGSCLLRHAD